MARFATLHETMGTKREIRLNFRCEEEAEAAEICEEKREPAADEDGVGSPLRSSRGRLLGRIGVRVLLGSKTGQELDVGSSCIARQGRIMGLYSCPNPSVSSTAIDSLWSRVSCVL